MSVKKEFEKRIKLKREKEEKERLELKKINREYKKYEERKREKHLKELEYFSVNLCPFCGSENAGCFDVFEKYGGCLDCKKGTEHISGSGGGYYQNFYLTSKNIINLKKKLGKKLPSNYCFKVGDELEQGTIIEVIEHWEQYMVKTRGFFSKEILVNMKDARLK